MTDTSVRRDTDEQRVADLVEQLLSEHDPKGDRTEFLGAQFDLGLAWVHFPEGAGGLGLSPRFGRIVQQRIAEAGGPPPAPGNALGYGMGGAVVATHGTDEQKRRLLRPLFTSEEIWCQLFSEPGAGSDLAGLSTRAVRDGDEWVVNGQKVWNSGAHRAKWGMLVARTDPEQPKHRGMTYFIMDMQAPGVEVRPLRQITGQAEFNEVYMTDVRIPDSLRIGDVGDGWRVALTTLMNERVMIGGGSSPQRGDGVIQRAVKLWKERGHTDPALRDELMTLWVEAEVHRLMNLRAGALRRAGTPGPDGSLGKIASASINQRVMSFCIRLMGPEGTLYGSYEMDPETTGLMAAYSNEQAYFLRTRGNSIEGGTSEIMRNIVGERVLGLPGDVRVDKDVPWNEVPRS